VTPAEVSSLLARGQRAEALSAAESGVRDNPGDGAWLHVLGVAQFGNGSREEALMSLNRAATAAPGDPFIRNTLGALLIEMQRADEGEKVLRDGLRIAPDLPELLANLGIALRRLGRHEEVVEVIARVPPAWPNAARAEVEVAQSGVSLMVTGRLEQAVRAFRVQLALRPDSRAGAQNLALALHALQRHDEAAAALRAALDAGHRDADILAMLVNAKGMTCDWVGLDDTVEELRRAARDPGTRPPHPQTAQYLPQVSAGEQKHWAENFTRVIFGDLAPIERRAAAAPGKKLRVGYLSSDFRDHAVSWLFVGLAENHDRERFEVRCYSTGPRVATAVRERIARSMDEFVDCSTVPGRAVAERIAADGIDVLVDMGGHTQGARLDILAYRAAPVQGHFLGYAGTTGAAFVDFFVADAVTVPPGAQGAFTEDVMRLPRCFMPNDPTRPVPKPARRAEHGLREDALVLCSFNQAVKIRREVFEQWCDLLRALPKAQLMLRAPGDTARRRLEAAAAARGVAAQLVFAPHLPTREMHMARLAAADIALDTYPYGSHTNAADALWAGVPLITTFGETFASRVGASLLATAGLSQWAFEDPRAASDEVLALAKDPARLAAAKEKVREARASKLFDAAGFARDFEQLLLAAAGREAP
jgi:protein O-GlcNAc transferase